MAVHSWHSGFTASDDLDIEQPDPRSHVNGDRRRKPRFETAQPVAIETGSKRIPADLIELSQSGLRLVLEHGHALQPGDPMTLILMDGTRVTGRIAWCEARRVGAVLHDDLGDAEHLAELDHRGEHLFRQVVKLQRGLRRSAAR